MRIHLWSDVVCPFCYLGKHRLQSALAEWEHAPEVELIWHAFELDPHAPAATTEPLAAQIAAKYRISLAESEASQRSLARQFEDLGLTFNWVDARPGNTFDAHRVIQYAQQLSPADQLADRVVERLMRGYFSEGLPISDRRALARLAGEAGLDPAAVLAMLETDEFADQVRADEQTAARLGINGVPFFVFDDRLGLSGAQPVSVITQALDQAWASRAAAALSE